MTNSSFFRRLGGLVVLGALSLSAACEKNPALSDPEQSTAVVVNSVDNTLSIIPLENGTPRIVGLATQASTPVDLAVRGTTAVVPLGTYPFAAVVDLKAGQVVHRVPLPANSGATGVAFVNDTVALVANPGRNSVTPVRVRSGTAGAAIPVGVYPQAIVSDRGNAYVINANLVNFAPVGPGSVTVINAAMGVVRTIPLRGVNPAAGAVLGDKLYVINSGNVGQANGSMSVIDLGTLTEEAHITGFGAFPTTIEASSAAGALLIGGFGYGIAVWNPATGQFAVPPQNSLKPGGVADVGDIAVNEFGQVFFTAPRDCVQRGRLYLIGANTALAGQAETGVCPLGVEITRF
jgi:hypothetical protein